MLMPGYVSMRTQSSGGCVCDDDTSGHQVVVGDSWKGTQTRDT